jgi:hypothetical protein
MEVLTIRNGEDSEGSGEIGRKEMALLRVTCAAEAYSREEDRTRYAYQGRQDSVEDNDYGDAPSHKPDGFSATAATEPVGVCVSSGSPNQ